MLTPSGHAGPAGIETSQIDDHTMIAFSSGRTASLKSVAVVFSSLLILFDIAELIAEKTAASRLSPLRSC